MNESSEDITRSFVNLTTGRFINQYRILKKIVSGGMGEVWECEDSGLNRKVAIKFLAAHLCEDKTSRKRFQKEALATASLNHPNIITIFEVNQIQNRPYFVMEFMDMGTLKEYCSNHELSIERILEIAIQICNGLHHAHSRGIVHRDIKPSNILIDNKDQIKIADFGLASVAGLSRLTKTGTTLGTVGYISPEQINSGLADKRSDLFSVGVLFYEMITKRNPFLKENQVATFQATLNETPEPMARYKSHLPAGLQAIVDKALQKDPSLRYQSAEDFAADLKREAKCMSQPEYETIIITKSRNKKLKYASGALTGLLLLVVTLATYFNFFDKATELVYSPKATQLTFTGNVQFGSISSDGSLIAYVKQADNNTDKVYISDILGAREIEVFEYPRIGYLKWSPDGREMLIWGVSDSGEACFLVPRLGGASRRYNVEGKPGGWSHDSKSFVTAPKDGTRLIHTDKITGDTSIYVLSKTIKDIILLDWSRDGKWILFSSTALDEGIGLWLVHPDGTNLREIYKLGFWTAALSPQLNSVFLTVPSGTSDRLLRLGLDWSAGKAHKEPELVWAGLGRSNHIDISADGERILCSMGIHYTNLWKVLLKPSQAPDKAETKMLTQGTSHPHQPAVSPDGQRIVYSAPIESDIQLFEIPSEGGKATRITHEGMLYQMAAWSEDGSRLACIFLDKIDSRELKLSLVDVSTGSKILLGSLAYSGSCHNYSALEWYPGENIITENYNCTGFRFFHTKSGDFKDVVIADSNEIVYGAHYSPDKKFIAFYWNKSGEELDGIWTFSMEDSSKTLILKESESFPLGWSPDQTWIYYYKIEARNGCRILRVNAKTSKKESLAVLNWNGPTHPWISLSPDGQWAVASVSDKKSDLWLIEKTTNQ